MGKKDKHQEAEAQYAELWTALKMTLLDEVRKESGIAVFEQRMLNFMADLEVCYMCGMGMPEYKK